MKITDAGELATMVLRKNGKRITPQRIEIIKILSLSHKNLTVNDIFQKIRLKYKRISIDTVYRALNMFVQLGLITQLNLQNGEPIRFEYHGDKPHPHAVCLKCGKLICITSAFHNNVFYGRKSYKKFLSELSQLQVIQEKEFLVTNLSLEIFGYCKECRSSLNKQS